MALARQLRSFAERTGLRLEVSIAQSGAEQYFCYAPDKGRRYICAHIWNPGQSTVLWVMFNPGTGETEVRRRPTLERCINWSEQRGHGSLLMCNLSTLRTKSAKDVPASEVLDEPLNIKALAFARGLSSEVFAAWGSSVGKRAVPVQLLSQLDGALCLGATSKGHPRHPLYVSSRTRIGRWSSSGT